MSLAKIIIFGPQIQGFLYNKIIQLKTNVKSCFLCEETWPLPHTQMFKFLYFFTNLDFLSNRIITLKYQQRFTALACKDIVIRKPDSIPVEKEKPSLHVTCNSIGIIFTFTFLYINEGDGICHLSLEGGGGGRGTPRLVFEEYLIMSLFPVSCHETKHMFQLRSCSIMLVCIVHTLPLSIPPTLISFIPPPSLSTHSFAPRIPLPDPSRNLM